MSKIDHAHELLPSKKDSSQFDMLFPILDSVYNEIKDLSKKKPDSALNEMKVKMTNKILSRAKKILRDDLTLEFLELLDENSLPSNSDAVIIIAQFRAAMQRYKEKYFGWNGTETTWTTSD